MKIISVILYCILFNTNLYSQTDSSFYYPMNLDDRWQYKEPPPPEDLYPQETRIGPDTTFSNGYTYKSFVKKYVGYPDTIGVNYERKIDTKVYRYYPAVSEEYLIYDFSKQVDDTIAIYPNPMGFAGDTSIVIVLDKGIRSIFGKSRRYITFYTQTTRGVLYWINTITDGLGLTFYQFEPGYQLTLDGAIINNIHFGNITNVQQTKNLIPGTLVLFQNYPNPFNSSTIIYVKVPKGESFSIYIYDILGKLIRKLNEGKRNVDIQSVVWDGRNDSGVKVSSGVYLYQIRGKIISASKKMLLIQ
jgi:hypothetical protein